MTVVTRFAPSPTGYLHVGGARTALFNFLLARRHGGTYLLRIEDTDLQRSTDAAVDALLADLAWLGLTHDNLGSEPRQSLRLDAYNTLFHDLIARGLAYEAFESREELDNQRAQAARAKRPYLYPRPTYTPEQLLRFRDEGRVPVLRFRIDETRDYFFDDLVLGPNQGVDRRQVQDFVIRKADGMPTYHFAVVVDDADMGITHVLRGQEHLLNTCQHVALMDALGYDRPQFAHLPVILTTDGSKMGKRDRDKLVKAAALQKDCRDLAYATGLDSQRLCAWVESPTLQLDPAEHLVLLPHLGLRESDLPQISVDDFRRAGYLPETLLNFLALLGWSPGDDRERLGVDELVALFSLERVGRANAKFDEKKLIAFNTEASAAATPERLRRGMREYLAANPDSPVKEATDAELDDLLRMCEGFHTFADVEDKSRMFFQAPTAYDPPAVAKFLDKGEPSGWDHLRAARDVLADNAAWDVATLERVTKALCDARGVGLGKVAQPIRIALAGTGVSPPIFDTLAFLGRDETLRRVDALTRSAP